MMMPRAKVVGLGQLWMLSLLSVIGLGSAHAGDPLSGPSLSSESLIDAVRQQNKSAIEELLDQNVDVNAAQADGATALHWAVHPRAKLAKYGQMAVQRK